MVDVRIKPLEWRGTEGVWAKSDALFGATYRITEYAGMAKPFKLETVGFVGPNGHYGLLDEAKAAAQADYESRIRSTLSDAVAEREAEPVAWMHPDDLAVDRFAAAMKAKLAKKRADGRGGWDNPAECSAGYLSLLLVEHIEKGDPLDVGNLAMMLHQRGDRIADERERDAARRVREGGKVE